MKISFPFLFLISSISFAGMVPGDQIGNDQEKEKVCLSRSKGKKIPFEISNEYVISVRKHAPDATFVAIDGDSPQLIECRLSGGTGRFEPISMSPQQWYWRVIRPEGFSPGLNTYQGQEIAAKACADEAVKKNPSEGFDHYTYNLPVEVGIDGKRYNLSGKKADRYDIYVSGMAFYKSTGLDLNRKKFTCLMSPKLDIKAIQIK